MKYAVFTVMIPDWDLAGTVQHLAALGYDGVNIWQVHVPQVKIHGLTGAGDAMTAGLIASFSQGKSIADSLRFSSALATASTLNMEPGNFNDKNLKDIFKKTTIQEIVL